MSIPRLHPVAGSRRHPGRFARFRRSLYRVAIVLAGLTFLLGLWRVFVERDRWPGPFWQLLFPLLVLRLALTLYRRSGNG